MKNLLNKVEVQVALFATSIIVPVIVVVVTMAVKHGTACYIGF